jgi:hypothetical protein
LPETKGFSRWVRIDAVTGLADDAQPDAKLPADWQKLMICEYCQGLYKSIFKEYLDGEEKDGHWIATVQLTGTVIQVSIDYETALFEVNEVEETLPVSPAAEAETLPVSPAANGETLPVSPAANGETLPVAPAANGETLPVAPAANGETLAVLPAANGETLAVLPAAEAETLPVEPAEEDTTLVSLIANCFEGFDFDEIGSIDPWLHKASVTTLERIAQGAEQLAQMAKAALNSR